MSNKKKLSDRQPYERQTAPSKRASRVSRLQGISGLRVLDFNKPEKQFSGGANQDAPRKAAEALLSLSGAHSSLERPAPSRNYIGLSSSQDKAKTPTRPDIPIRKFMSTLPENRSSPAPKRMFNSPSAGRYTFRLNRQMPIPTRKRPATMSQKLLKVLHCIKDEKMTLPSFLEELFKSDDPHVAGWTEQFHNSEGAVRLLKVLENKAQVKEEDVVYSHNV